MKIIKSLVGEFEDYPHPQISSIIELIKIRKAKNGNSNSKITNNQKTEAR